MIHMSKNVRLTVVLIAVWTIVQTIFHFFWVIYSYLMTVCQIKPTYYDVVFVYLTYFYRKSCGPIDLKNEAYFLNNTIPDSKLFYANETVSEALYNFLKAVLKDGILPDQSNVAARTDIYLYLFIYTDVTWIVSSVFLFVGAFFERKKKIMSVLFYGPWMLVCVFVAFLDVVSSVHFGLDIIYTRTYTTWLNFIGVTNYKDFDSFNDGTSSKLLLALPSTIIVVLLSRLFVVWLINVVCFFVVLYMAIPDICFKDIVRPASRSRKSGGSKLKFDTGGELNLNSSEARIRNWQLFYGAIEANSTMATASPNSSDTRDSTDHNSNSRSREEDIKINKKHLQAIYEQNTPTQEPSNVSFVDSGFRRYSDVTHGVSVLPTAGNSNIKMEVLRSQLPWSYMSPEGRYVKRNQKHPKTQKSVQIRDTVIDSTRL